MGLIRDLVGGAVAGAAGTTALNAVTYLDMAVRGRASSSTPEQTVETMAGKAGVEIPGDEETTRNRLSGLGPMMGILTGVGTGALLGAFRAGRAPLPVGVGVATVVAMAGSNAPMTALGVTDPTSWTASEWASDALPHAAYGLVAVVALRLMDRRAA
jgi:hypothetical protein